MSSSADDDNCKNNKPSISESLARGSSASVGENNTSEQQQQQQQHEQQPMMEEQLQQQRHQQQVAAKEGGENVTNTTDSNSSEPFSKLRVSGSALSLALTASPLNTPRDDEAILATATGAMTDKQYGSNNSREFAAAGDAQDVSSKNNDVRESRKRSLAVEEDILMGSRNSSVNSLVNAGGEAEGKSAESERAINSESYEVVGMPKTKKMKIEEGIVMSSAGNTASAEIGKGVSQTEEVEIEESMPDAKRMKVEEARADSTTKESIDEDATDSEKGQEKKPSSTFETYHKPAPWSSRQNLSLNRNHSPTASNYDTPHHPRWRSHQLAQDYISLASAITLPPTHLGPYDYSPKTGNYPIEQVTALGYLTSPLRRPTVVEKWNPYEISTFEAALALYGKQFHQVQKWVKTKTTKEIVEFYYIWKKSSHGRRWKGSFEEEISESDSEEDENNDGDNKNDKGDGDGKGRLGVKSPGRSR